MGGCRARPVAPAGQRCVLERWPRSSRRPGAPAEAVDSARRAVELDPDDEQGVARLIALLDQHGDRSGALTVYAALERRLADGFSAQPAPETRALMKALRQRPTPVYTSPSRPTSPRRGSVVEPTGDARSIAAGEVAARPRAAPLHGRCRWRARRDRTGGCSWGRRVRQRDRTCRPHALPSRWSLSGCTAPDADLAWLREGMVELLTMRLSGSGGMTVIEPGRVLAAWHGARRTDSLLEEPPATACEVREAGRRRADRVRERDRNVGSSRAGRLDAST